MDCTVNWGISPVGATGPPARARPAMGRGMQRCASVRMKPASLSYLQCSSSYGIVTLKWTQLYTSFSKAIVPLARNAIHQITGNTAGLPPKRISTRDINLGSIYIYIHIRRPICLLLKENTVICQFGSCTANFQGAHLHTSVEMLSCSTILCLWPSSKCLSARG